MNIDEILKKPFDKLTKEEIEWVFANLDWGKLFESYVKQEEESQRLSENN
jgi:hypothetical protein